MNGNDDPGRFEHFRRLVVLGQLVLRRAAVLDGQIEDDDEDEHRHAAGDDAHERHQRVDAGCDGRGLLGPQREIGKHHRACSLRIMTKMNPARLRIVATPPARTKFMARAAVLAGGRIVVIAEEKDGVGGRADFPCRGLDEGEAQIARLVLEAVEVARDAALRRDGDQRRAVRELVGLDVIRVLKPDDAREPLDGALRTGQEVPAVGGAEPAVALDVLLLLHGGLLGRVARIDADRDDVELFADVESQLGQAIGDAVHDHRTKHRTAVVHEVEQHRPAVIEVLAEPDDAAGLIAEHQVHRQLGVEHLRDRDLAGELRRRRGVGLGEARFLSEPWQPPATPSNVCPRRERRFDAAFLSAFICGICG